MASCLVVVALPAQAADKTKVAFVSEQGSDSGNTCAVRANPCKTLSHAVTHLASNATIWVSGTVKDNVAIPGHVHPVAIRGVAGTSPVVDGDSKGRVIEANGDLVLENVTVRGGRVAGNGAGVLMNSGALTVRRSTIDSNVAANPSKPSLGGGIYSGSTGAIQIIDSTISNNRAGEATVESNWWVTAVTATGSGGGVYAEQAPLTITRSGLNSNAAFSGDGGAFAAMGSAQVTISDSTVWDNYAQVGGAGYGTALTVKNSTIAKNAAVQQAAFSTRSNGTFKFFASTIASNTTQEYGARLFNIRDGSMTTVGSIFSDNWNGGCGGGSNSSWSSGGYNISDVSGCGMGQGTDKNNVNPGLGSFGDHGGPFPTYSLADGSASRNVVPTGLTYDGVTVCGRVDARGVAGPVSGASACAIGAHEPANVNLQSQQSLSVTGASAQVNQETNLNVSGGSGDGMVWFSVHDGTASGCSLTASESPRLTSMSSGTCVVTAHKGRASGYQQATSEPVSVSRTRLPQSEIYLYFESQPNAGERHLLTPAGGSGSGTYSFSLQTGGDATGCALDGAYITATSAGSCYLRIHKAGDDMYEPGQSEVYSVYFAPLPQAPLAVSTVRIAYSEDMRLQATGGTGNGAVTFTAQSTNENMDWVSNGCWVENGNQLRTHGLTWCRVIATKAASGNYAKQESAPTAVLVSRGSQEPITLTEIDDPEGDGSVFGVTGGYRWSDRTYSIKDGTAKQCRIVEHSSERAWFEAATVGTCVVTVHLAESDLWFSGSSAPTTFRIHGRAQAKLAVSTKAGTVGKALSLKATGGSGAGATTYTVVKSGTAKCSIDAKKPAILNAKAAGTCVVRAAKASDATFEQATSADTSIKFAEPKPGKVSKLKVAGKDKASSRTITWSKPSSGGKVASYQVVITKGTKKLLTTKSSSTKLVVKKSKLAKGNLVVTVTAVNSTGSGSKVTAKFKVK